MKHILFVDDEPNVLTGLQRMLHSMRREWDMAFVPGGEEALQAMSRQSYDVIVSDMRMPGMNGVQLLETVMHEHANTIRIALSGHSEMEMILESVRAAHQYLAKPCSAETLKTTIDRACALRELLSSATLAGVVGQIESLPSLPTLYMDIIREIGSADGSLARVGKIIEQDVAMTARILQVVNSAFFGLQNHVGSPSQAATLLGIDVIRGLVLSTRVFSEFDSCNARLNMEALWQHSTQTGALAKLIAEQAGQDVKTGDFALMAGLLHDVGKLILASHFPEACEQVQALKDEQRMDDSAAECEVLGCCHGQIGAYLLGIWGLPNPIVEAVAYHHNPVDSVGDGFSPLTAVHAANALLCAHAAPSATAIGEYLDRDYLERLGIDSRITDWDTVCRTMLQKGAVANA